MIPNVTDKELRQLAATISDNQQIVDLTALFELLSNPTRLKIVWLLTQREELCVSELAQILSTSMAAVSMQLRLLREANLVKTHRLGKQVCYSLYDRKQFSTIINQSRPARPPRLAWLGRA